MTELDTAPQLPGSGLDVVIGRGSHREASLGTSSEFPRIARETGLASPSRGVRYASETTYILTKRILDVVLACVLLMLSSPLFVMISLAISLEDRGPVFFVQTRVGKGGKPFAFYKFRSMVPNAEALKDEIAGRNEASGPIFKMRQDPRITRVGRRLRKWSLDELPQLINVLRGDLSLVGPRPHLPGEVRSYTPQQAQRLAVQPGMVCLREVSGRSELSFERWIELDLEYIRSRSLATDLSILLRLPAAVLGGSGAY